MNKLNQIFTIFKLIVTVIVVGLAALLMLTVLPIRGSFKVLTVLSGSMEPAIKTGSVVIVAADSAYQVNDVVTFVRPNTKELVTHRIAGTKYVDSKRTIYTKGDNNEELDTWTIDNQAIVGKVRLTIPYLGYVQRWLRTPVGFVAAVVLPAAIIIYGELMNIRNEIWKLIQRKSSGGVMAVGLIVLLALPMAGTKAMLFDKETSTGNSIGVATSYTNEEVPLAPLRLQSLQIENDLGESTPTPTVASEITPTEELTPTSEEITPTPTEELTPTPTPTQETDPICVEQPCANNPEL